MPTRSALETGSVDLVTCAQAFHWFDNEALGRRDPRGCCIPAVRWRWSGTTGMIVRRGSMRSPVVIEGYAGDTPRQRTGRWRWVLSDPRFVLEKEIVLDHPHRMARRDASSGSPRRAMPPIFLRREGALRQKTDDILRQAGLGDADEVVFPYVTQLRFC